MSELASVAFALGVVAIMFALANPELGWRELAVAIPLFLAALVVAAIAIPS